MFHNGNQNRNNKFAKRFFFLLCTCFAFSFIVSPPVSALTEYQSKQITDHLNSPKMNNDTSIFDGKQFIPGVDLNSATTYYNNYLKGMKGALRGWKMLSSTDKASADGKALYERLKKKQDWAQAMQAAYPDFRAAQSAKKAPSSSATRQPTAPPPTASQPVAKQTTPQTPVVESGGLTDYQKKQITRFLDGPSMKQDTGIFDGKKFAAGVPFQKIKDYYNGYINSFNNASHNWSRKLSSSRQNTPDGQALLKRLKEAKVWADAMTADFKNVQAQAAQQQKAQRAAQAEAAKTAGAQKAAHKQVCKAFQDQAMLPLNREPMQRLIRQMQHKNQQIGSADQVHNHQDIAQQVVSVCESVDFKTLISQPCWYVVGRADFDPAFWCTAAAKADELIKGAALNSAKRNIEVVGSATVQTPEDLIQREGWLTFEGPVTFKEKLYFSSHGRENQMKHIDALMAAAGITNAEDALWGDQKKRVDALRKEVEKTAQSWKLPEEQADNYSTKLARRQIEKMHPGAKVYKAYLSRASYKIIKNSLGVPLRQTMPGYVLFKLKEDPFCQLRSYTLTETYEGGGKYRKAAGVRFGYVRFQKCE